MADDNFRPYRSRASFPRDDAGPAADDTHDPLAELARLIGQGDPNAETGRSETYRSARPSNDPEPSGADWSPEWNDREDRRYAPSALPPASYNSYEPPAPSYADEPPAGNRYFSGPPAQFEGFREPADADYETEQKPFLPPRQLPAYATASAEDDYEYDEPDRDGDESYADDQYDDPSRRRRSGVIVVMAVLGLAVIGSAAAFGYRAMFGGSVLPALPPIIQASNTPTRIAPNGDAQANNTPQPGAASASATETLVPREEQPVTIAPPKAAPRVVATIPVSPPGSMQPGLPSAAGQMASAQNSPWPPSPAVAPANPPPMATLPAPAPAGSPPPATAPLPAPAAQALTEPNRVHTVTIRADQNGQIAQTVPPTAATAPASAPPPAARSAPKPTASKPRAANAAPSGPNAPLSIVPGAQGEIAAPARAPAAPMTVANAGPAPARTAAPTSGGYSVQVTSQRSEAEAQTAFRELQGQFPNQLRGREPIIRRADLGEKGTYYRALVGPFASMEQAASMCSSLKAAGGNCLVQRN